MSGVEKEDGVNAAHRTVNTAYRTGGSSARPVHGAFQHSMVRRCFNHDYRSQCTSALRECHGGDALTLWISGCDSA